MNSNTFRRVGMILAPTGVLVLGLGFVSFALGMSREIVDDGQLIRSMLMFGGGGVTLLVGFFFLNAEDSKRPVAR